MLTLQRIGFVLALTAAVVLADATSALAQRGGFNFGGGGSNKDSNNNQDSNRRNRDRDNDDNDNESDGEQVQKFLGGDQGNQNNNSGNLQQFRRNNQQGGQGSNQFKKSNQVQQFIQGGQNGQGKNWQTQKYSRHNDLQKWVIGFNGGPQPFSDDWYDHHPHAWKHNHHHDHDWQFATSAGVFGWLGWQAARPYNNTVYIYDPVPVQTVIVDGQPQVVIDPATGEWMTLGAYTLLTGAGDPGTRILQLSVDKQGNIRGSYYDMITNDTHNVIGLIDRKTQQARWTLDSNQQLTFVATLDQLTASQGVVNAKLPGGQVQQWQLVRLENGQPANN